MHVELTHKKDPHPLLSEHEVPSSGTAVQGILDNRE